MLKRTLAFVSLFSSIGTLVCCALPALFVTLGLGATFVSLLGVFPQLIWLSERKDLVFGVAGAMLLVAGLARLWGGQQECPVEPELAAACRSVKGAGGLVFYLSAGCYLVGAFFAFVAPEIF